MPPPPPACPTRHDDRQSPAGRPRLSRLVLAGAVLASLLALGAAFFEWWLIDRFPALVFMPGCLLIPLGALSVATLSSLVELRHVRRGGLGHALPLLICAATLTALALVPFTRLWLAADFAWHRAEREAVVADVEAGRLAPDVPGNGMLIALGHTRPRLSAGSNEVLVEMRNGKPWVLFFTFRGVLNHYSGFLHVPDDGDPHDFHDLSHRRHQVVSWGGRWYFVAR